YHPSTGLWTQTRSMSQPRDGHSATLLPNGKVLIAGGAPLPNRSQLPLDSAELYDPTIGTWSLAGTMTAPHQSHAAILMPDGKVLIAGGTNNVFSTELYDPNTNSWTATKERLNIARAGCTAVLLPDQRRVLVVGGGVANGYTNTAEIYDAA